MNDTPAEPHIIRLADLPQRKPFGFDISPNESTLKEIAQSIGASALRKLRFIGTLQTEGKHDWRLEAKLGATVIQDCVITLEPVTTRIDETITRRFLKDWELPAESDEMEMPEDDSTEPLTPEIDLINVLTEALAIAIPDYPKADGASLGQSQFAADGVTPMTDEDTKPFAGLAALKEKLEKPDE